MRVELYAMRRLLLLVILIFPPLVKAEVREVAHLPRTNIKLEARCPSAEVVGNCAVYRVENREKKKIISFPFPPSSINFDHGVFVITFPCGTQCSATYFYKESGALGGPFPLVEAYDVERGVVLSMAQGALQMYGMFAKGGLRSIRQMTLDVKSDVDLVDVVRGVKLVDHTFVVSYIARDGNAATAVCAVPDMAER